MMKTIKQELQEFFNDIVEVIDLVNEEDKNAGKYKFAIQHSIPTLHSHISSLPDDYEPVSKEVNLSEIISPLQLGYIKFAIKTNLFITEGQFRSNMANIPDYEKTISYQGYIKEIAELKKIIKICDGKTKIIDDLKGD